MAFGALVCDAFPGFRALPQACHLVAMFPPDFVEKSMGSADTKSLSRNREFE
jgi:hypothetical protein